MEKKYSVIDLFCGIGGLSAGFEKAGFTIVYAADIDQKKTSIYNKIHKDNVCVSTDIFSTPLSSIPDSDIIIGSLPLTVYSHSKQKYSHFQNIFLNYYKELLSYKMPLAFLLETSSLYHKAKQELSLFYDDLEKIGYQIHYKVLECSMFSNLPVYDRKTYIIGIRKDMNHHRFIFPSTTYNEIQVNEKHNFFEKHSTIDSWYRRITIRNSYNFEQGKYYLKQRNKMYESKFFFLSRIYMNYLYDVEGLRRLTHNELAYLKGLPLYNYNNLPNKLQAYNYLLESSNVHTTYALAEQLLFYLKGETSACPQENNEHQLIHLHEYVTLLQPIPVTVYNPEHSISQIAGYEPVKDEWSTLINSIENTSLSAKERGTALEDLMIKFFSQIEGFVCRKNERTKTEEIDIVITNRSKTSAFANESPIFLCECKNYSSPITRKELNILIEKMRNRNQRCKLGFFIAWNGISEGFEEELLRKSESENLVIILEKDEIIKAIHEQNFLPFLEEKYYDNIIK